jgi:hypothetical protein
VASSLFICHARTAWRVRFVILHARTAWRARSSSFTLAPHGEFVFIIFRFLLDRGRFCPFLTEKELLTM